MVMAIKLTQFYILATVMDNTSSNNVMARSLTHLLWARYHLNYNAEEQRIRCMGHVINLVAQAMLFAIEEAEDPEVNDYFEIHKFEPVHLDDESAEKLYGVLDKEAEAGSSMNETEKADDNSDEEEEWSDEELADLLEAVESKESADAKAREQTASAIKKVCYKISLKRYSNNGVFFQI